MVVLHGSFVARTVSKHLKKTQQTRLFIYHTHSQETTLTLTILVLTV